MTTYLSPLKKTLNLDAIALPGERTLFEILARKQKARAFQGVKLGRDGNLRCIADENTYLHVSEAGKVLRQASKYRALRAQIIHQILQVLPLLVAAGYFADASHEGQQLFRLMFEGAPEGLPDMTTFVLDASSGVARIVLCDAALMDQK